MTNQEQPVLSEDLINLEEETRQCLVKLLENNGYQGAILIMCNPSDKEGAIHVHQSIVEIPADEAPAILNMVAKRMWDMLEQYKKENQNSILTEDDSKKIIASSNGDTLN